MKEVDEVGFMVIFPCGIQATHIRRFAPLEAGASRSACSNGGVARCVFQDTVGEEVSGEEVIWSVSQVVVTIKRRVGAAPRLKGGA
jgi:hypothetical protein